jgi:hypothetical protein
MAALKGEKLPSASVEMIMKSKEVKQRLIEEKPIKHEGVLAYALERAAGGGKIADSLRLLARAEEINTDWMQHWYAKSIDLIDLGYQEYTVSLLTELLGVMNPKQIRNLESWSNSHDEEREEKLEDFVRLLD